MIVETDKEFAVALVRGDDEVNEVKLKNALDATHLQLAAEAKVEQVTGGAMGFSGPVGLKGVRVVADPEVMRMAVAATGANRADHHLVGVVPGRDFTPDLVADIRAGARRRPLPALRHAARDQARHRGRPHLQARHQVLRARWRATSSTRRARRTR